MKKHLHLVIHHIDRDTTMNEARVAYNPGVDGIFLISHHGADNELFGLADEIKLAYPRMLVGLNLLQSDALNALKLAASAGVDMLWVDNPGVRSDGVTEKGRMISEWLAQQTTPLLFFGSVAFKYQPIDSAPGAAAAAAAGLGMIPTTSGIGTGHAPEVEKIKLMHEALSPGQHLAIASGITPDNVADYLPYAEHFLVATGVSFDEHHFDPIKVSNLQKAIAADRQRKQSLAFIPGNLTS